MWSWNENMEFIPNSHDFHRHAHRASKSEARRASDNYLQPSRVRQKINGRSSARRVGWRCVCSIFSIEQPDHEPKRLGFPTQLVNPLFFYAQNFVWILHNCPFVGHFGNHTGQPVRPWLFHTRKPGDHFSTEIRKAGRISYDSSSQRSCKELVKLSALLGVSLPFFISVGEG